MQKDNFTYSGFASNGIKVWYITSADNLLMEVELKHNKVNCLGKIPNTCEQMGAYRTLICISEKLYLIPFNASLLCTYDLNTEQFDFLDVFHHISTADKKYMKLYGRISYENELIMYGLDSTVFRYNILTNELKEYQIANKEVEKNGNFFMEDGFVIGDKLILPSSEKTILVEIDLITDRIEYYRIKMDVSDVMYQLVLYEEQSFYFVLFDKEWKLHIGVVGIQDYSLEDYQVYTPKLEKIENDNPENIPFVCGFVKENKILLLPGKQLETCIIDVTKKTCTVQRELVPSAIAWVTKGERCFYNYFAIERLDNGYYYSIQYGNKKMVMIHEDTLHTEERELEYNLIEDNVQMNKMIMDSSPILYEKDKYLNLQEYLELVKENNI